MNPLKVFMDADVLFAAASRPSKEGASHVVLQMGALTLVQCIASVQAVTEVERNIAAKRPINLPRLCTIISLSLTVVPDPDRVDLRSYAAEADPKDHHCWLPRCVRAVTIS